MNKTHSLNTTILVALIILLLVIGGVWYTSVTEERRLLLDRLAAMQESIAQLGTSTSTSNIALIGNMVFNSPGMVPDTWYVVSERPGAPALAYRLAFTEASQCLAPDAQARLCQLGVKFEGGTRVYLRGFLNERDSVVTVHELTLFAPAVSVQ